VYLIVPVDYTIDKKLGVVFTRAWGKLTDEDAFDYQRRLSVDSEFDPNFRQLADLSLVETFLVTSNGIQTLIDEDCWAPDSRRAFVSPSDLLFGMTRMGQTLMEGASRKMNVFRIKSEALCWLGIGENDAESPQD